MVTYSEMQIKIIESYSTRCGKLKWRAKEISVLQNHLKNTGRTQMEQQTEGLKLWDEQYIGSRKKWRFQSDSRADFKMVCAAKQKIGHLFIYPTHIHLEN